MISVCMASYNGEFFIKQQISSILAQLTAVDELIISDDGSVDNTLSIIKSFEDARIKLFHNQGKHGVIPNFENALSKAKGEYIFLSDQDDVWMPNKVEVCMKLLQQNTLVVHNANIINGEGINKGCDFFSLRGSKSGFLYNIWKNCYLGCCMCFHSQILKYVLPFPKHIEMHDRWVGLMSELHGKVIFEKQCLIGYRVHVNNVSNSTGKSVNSLGMKLSIRWWLLFYTLTRQIKMMMQ